MKHIKLSMAALAVALFAAVLIGGADNTADAQGPPAALTVANGEQAGAVDLSWDAFPGVDNYTVGWLAVSDYEANTENNQWLKYFAYSNVGDVHEWTVRRLTPGIDYWLIACQDATDVAAGAAPQCTGWERLTLAAGPVCPAAPMTGTEQPQTVINGDYDADNDGLIEIRNLAQLDAIRYDLNGDGQAERDSDNDAYAAAFPGAANGMGCPSDGCMGFELVTDLDFDTNGNGRADARDDYWNNGKGWDPIQRAIESSDHDSFRAEFDGGGHTISNLYINRSGATWAGLFGHIRGGSVIGVGLVSVDVTGNQYVGGLAGQILQSVSISESYATGVVNGGQQVGGLVGHSRGSITDSYSSGTVTAGGYFVGGLVGASDGATITGSYATGPVTGDGEVGGLVGQHANGSITASYATGAVTGNRRVGGLIGNSYRGSITASYATGAVVAADNVVGGLVGQGNTMTIISSYATGAVTSGRGWAGGLIGSSDVMTLTGSYAIGAVTITGSNSNYVGGLVGWSRNARVTSSYWNTETSGQSESAGGEGKTTAELQSPTGNTGIYAGWNPSWWDFGASSQYPVLQYRNLSVTAQRR